MNSSAIGSIALHLLYSLFVDVNNVPCANPVYYVMYTFKFISN